MNVEEVEEVLKDYVEDPSNSLKDTHVALVVKKIKQVRLPREPEDIKVPQEDPRTFLSIDKPMVYVAVLSYIFLGLQVLHVLGF